MRITCPECKTIIEAENVALLNNALYDHIRDTHPDKVREYLEI